MNTININGKKYDIIRGTQSDGRCFFASVFYVLNGKKAETDEKLNRWIRENIIDPILETEADNCALFSKWALEWKVWHNDNIKKGNSSKIEGQITVDKSLDNKISSLTTLFGRMQALQKEFHSLKTENISNNESILFFIDEIILKLNEIYDTYKSFFDKPDTKWFNNFKQTIDGIKKRINSAFKKDKETVKNEMDEFSKFFDDAITFLLNNICIKFKETYTEYSNIIDKYKLYIGLLNMPIDGSYEYAEPRCGPIDILLESKTLNINSIHIYNQTKNTILNYESKEKKPAGIEVYLYYSDEIHYNPLMPSEGLEPDAKGLEPDAKEPDAKEPVVKEPVVKEPDAKEPDAKEPDAKEPDAKEPVAKGLEPDAKGLEPDAKGLEPDAKGLEPVAKKQIKKDLVKDLEEKKEKEKEEPKIPNSVIIYIKTRIPNFYKLNYEPFMTVPTNKSHTVYFDPLIKYYEGPIKNIPKDALYTQFFQAAEFESMINRILSDFRYMQKPRTFSEAYDERIIDNNMKITLKTLFKNNNLFYINKKPYTIVNSRWNPGNWQIDKKPIQKLLSQFSHLTQKQLQEETQKEEDDIPEVLRQGNLASSDLSKEENTTLVASGLQNALEKKEDNKENFKDSDSFVNKDKLPGVSEDIKRLYTEFVKQNVPLNYTDIPDLARDPLTLSLLIDPAELLKFINKNKNTKIIDLYSSHMNLKKELQMADKEYVEAYTELIIYKTTFNAEIIRINNIFQNMIETKVKNKSEITEGIETITNIQINYIKIIFRISDAIYQIYNLQKQYFVSLHYLLLELKEQYVNIIKYYEQPVLAIKCIEYDIVTINYFINKDVSNPSFATYFSNYDKFINFYNDKLYKNQELFLNPQINYMEKFDLYYNNPNMLLIEKQQYELYGYQMFLYYSYNQFSIWVILFKSVDTFTKTIGKDIAEIINDSATQLGNYDSIFPEPEQSKFLESIKADGINYTYNKLTKQIDWFLVKEDGSRCIQPSSKKTLKQMEEEHQQRVYIETIRAQVNSYDAIILYIYLLEITCLRQHRLYVAEENVSYLNLEYSLTLNQYYSIINKNIVSDKKMDIPESIFWDTSNLNNKDKLYERYTSNKKISVVYKGRLKSIEKSRKNLIEQCEKIFDLITPTISNSGFIKKCEAILQENMSDIPEYSFRSSYWLEKTIKDYNIELTQDFIYNISNVIKNTWYDRIIDVKQPEDYLDWIVYNNGFFNIESIYAAISDALNGEIDLNGLASHNPYTELEDGKQIFTVSSLTRLIEENAGATTTNDDYIISVLEQVLQIKIIVFDMTPREKTEYEISMGDMVKFKDKTKGNNEIYRVLNIDTQDNLVTLYDGFRLMRGINYDDIKLSKKNITSFFRINCGVKDISKDYSPDDYVYLVKTIDAQKTNYRLVRNSGLPNYIYKLEQIPPYISYFIYNNCLRFLNFDERSELKEKYNVYGLDSFQPIFDSFDKKYEHQIELSTSDIEKLIQDELKELNQELDKKKVEEKTIEDNAQKSIIKIDIENLKERIKQLNHQLEYIKLPSEALSSENPGLKGGVVNVKPSEQYISNISPANNPNITNNVFYLPRQTTYQRRLPYNVSQNKAKDQKSKMSFYITVELELFPGTSPNVFQTSVIKCQSTFERIREAYADLFGYQYRPAAMSEAYQKKDTKDEKKDTKDEKKDTKDEKNEKNEKDEKKVGGKTKKNKKKKGKQTNKTRKFR